MLVRCNDCGRDVATSAPACPHCGSVNFRPPVVVQVPSSGGGEGLGLVLWIVIFVVLLLLIGGGYHMHFNRHWRF